jgi:hypothetical protein
MKPLLTSFEQAPTRPRPALQPLAPAARLIFGMACRTLGRAQGRSLLPEALSRRGRHSPPGRSRIFASIRDQQLYRKDRMRVGVSSLSRSLFPRQRRRGCQPSLGSLFPNQFFFLLPVSQYLLFETSSTAPGVRSPPPNIGGVVPAGPLKWLPSPPPLTTGMQIGCARRVGTWFTAYCSLDIHVGVDAQRFAVALSRCRRKTYRHQSQ